MPTTSTVSAIIVVDYIHATCTCHVVVIIVLVLVVVVIVVVVIVVVVIVVVIIVVVLNSFVGEAMIRALPPCQYPPPRRQSRVDGGPHSSPCHCPLLRSLHRRSCCIVGRSVVASSLLWCPCIRQFVIRQVVSILLSPLRCWSQVDGGLHRCCRGSVVSGATNPNVFYPGRPCTQTATVIIGYIRYATALHCLTWEK